MAAWYVGTGLTILLVVKMQVIGYSTDTMEGFTRGKLVAG